MLGGIAVASLLLYRLTSLPVAGQLSRPEFRLADTGGNWHHLLHEPFFLPYRGLAWLSRNVLQTHPTLALRLPSVLIALLALYGLMYTIRRWYGPRTAFFGFVILSTSSILLHLGRSATTDIVYFAALPILLWSHVALHQASTRRTLIGWLVAAICLLYIPGMLWFVAMQTVWQRKLIGEGYAQFGSWWSRLAVVVVALVSLVPLAYGFFKHVTLAYALGWLGLPSSLPTSTQILKNFAAAISFIFFRTPEDPSRWLDRLPLLGAFMLVCLIAGVFFYAGHIRAERTRLLAFLAILSFLLLGAGGPVARSILAPLLYIVSLGGLAYLLHYWLTMFPRNVSARWLGIGIVCLAIALTVTFNLRHYFVAWPHNQDTRSSFVYRPPQP